MREIVKVAFIESIESLLLAADSFDQIFLSPIMLSLIVYEKQRFRSGGGERGGWEGCVSATVQLTSRWLWRLWFSGCPAFLSHDVILIEPGRRGSAREGSAFCPASKPQEALGVRSSPSGWAALPDALRQHCGSSSPRTRAARAGHGCPGLVGARTLWLLWGGRFLPVSLLPVDSLWTANTGSTKENFESLCHLENHKGNTKVWVFGGGCIVTTSPRTCFCLWCLLEPGICNLDSTAFRASVLVLCI